MKKYLRSALVLMLVLCMVLPFGVQAASTTYIVMTIENDETGSNYYCITDESSHYLTAETNLLYEVVQLINANYYGNGKMYGFGSPAMQDVMDEGLKAYKGTDAEWAAYVDKYYADVNPETGDSNLKDILRNKDSVLGDLVPNVKHSISFQNTVIGDAKYGVTYTVSITRYGGAAGPKPTLNSQDHIAYVTGYPDGSFAPNAYITREEATTIFYRLLSEDSRQRFETNVCGFSDVAEGRWSRTAIATMANAGIITGYPDGTFAPTKRVTRAEFAVIAARFDSEAYTGDNLFPDIAGHWAAGYINQAASKGWVKGDENGNFRPNAPITRAEAVTMINRILNRLPENEADLLDGMVEFTDNMDPAKWYYLAIQEAANGHEYTRKADGTHESWTKLK